MDTIKYLKLVVWDEWLALKELIVEQKLLVLLVLVGLGGIIFYLKPFPPREINIAGGSPNGAYTRMAGSAAGYLSERGVNLLVSTTSGSVENGELLADPSIDVVAGFIQGGALTPEQAALVYSLGSVAYEPVWIFYKKVFAGKISELTDLQNFRVGLGPQKGGSRAMARELFKLNGIDIDANERFRIGPYTDQYRAFEAGELDVIFKVAPYFDGEVQALLRAAGTELFDFKHAPAYQKALPYIYELTLPAYSVDLKDKLPAHDISLIGTTTTLAVDKNLHPDIQTLLLMAVKDIQRSSVFLFFGKRGEFPAYMDPTIEASPVALRYYDYGVPPGMRYLPFWAAGFADRMGILLISLFTLIFPLSKLNLHLRALRYHIKHRRLYEEMLELEKELCDGQLTVDDKAALLQKLTVFNRHAISDHVPVGLEDGYFTLLRSIELLRAKIERME